MSIVHATKHVDSAFIPLPRMDLKAALGCRGCSAAGDVVMIEFVCEVLDDVIAGELVDATLDVLGVY